MAESPYLAKKVKKKDKISNSFDLILHLSDMKMRDLANKLTTTQ